MTERFPNELMTAHGSPTGPRHPSARNSAVEDPINVVNAAISSSPFPILGPEDTEDAGDAEDTEAVGETKDADDTEDKEDTEETEYVEDADDSNS